MENNRAENRIEITINDQKIEVRAGITVLQACELVGIEIPRFCYHERLAIAGNCRMCLVEIKGGPPKPAASCAMPVSDKMVVYTNTPKVKKAREGVLEFLLINHPLDCPICDQGGECDLQDETIAYGMGNSRFMEAKRAVVEKSMGPLIKTHMTRCIHCTRCIRFLSDAAGTDELGTLGRGEDMEVTNAIEKSLTSELSGNIIDLCPVGALTSKPYAFKARSWELRHCEIIDVMDAVGSAIRVDYRGQEVMRILPRLNEEINEEWISDKTRFACDGLGLQRLDRPYVRKNGKLESATWKDAFETISKQIKYTSGSRIAAIAGDLADCESMLVLKELMEALNCHNIDCRQDGARLNADSPCLYTFNTTIAGIEKADLCLLIGTNPRVEAPIINTRIRKRYLMGGFTIANIGPTDIDLSYRFESLGDSLLILAAIESEAHPFIAKIKAAKNPMMIIGQDILTRQDADAVLGYVCKIAQKHGFVREDWNGFNILHKAAARVGGLDVKFVPGEKGLDINHILNSTQKDEINTVYLLGADEIDMSKLGSAFVIYQGHHGDAGANRAGIILPGAAYTEKQGTYVNTEGRAQRAQRAVCPPGDAQEDWQIICELAKYLGQRLPYDCIEQIQQRLGEISSRFCNIDQIIPVPWQAANLETNLSSIPVKLTNTNFYMTDPISRASKTMAECSSTLRKADEL